ncbi:MAG: zinc-ribbon domain-containing protein [Bacteroidota bacterium]|nr:zinc-ribbon domain-containing protein [Bacteroidota bacterium]
MSYCIKCGKQNPDTAKFCTGCGITLKPVVTQSIPTTGPVDVNHPTRNQNFPTNRTKWLLLGIFVFLGLGTGAYFIFFNKKKQSSAVSEKLEPVTDTIQIKKELVTDARTI